jgi:hypothetical protein
MLRVKESDGSYHGRRIFASVRQRHTRTPRSQQVLIKHEKYYITESISSISESKIEDLTSSWIAAWVG